MGRDRARRIAYRKEYRSRPEVKARLKAKAKLRGSRRDARARWLKRKYGLSLADMDRLIIAQQGRCAICCRPFGPARKDLEHIDHCHTTGKIRGLLCHQCNSGIGNFKDAPRLMLAAIAYLETP